MAIVQRDHNVAQHLAQAVEVDYVGRGLAVGDHVGSALSYGSLVGCAVRRGSRDRWGLAAGCSAGRGRGLVGRGRVGSVAGWYGCGRSHLHVSRGQVCSQVRLSD